MPKGMDKNVEQIISLSEAIEAPVQAGQVIGEVKYVLEGETIAITNIISDREVKKVNLGNLVDSVFFSWFNVLR